MIKNVGWLVKRSAFWLQPEGTNTDCADGEMQVQQAPVRDSTAGAGEQWAVAESMCKGSMQTVVGGSAGEGGPSEQSRCS